MFDKIPVSTIKLLQKRFQAFLDVSLFEKLIFFSRVALGIKHSYEGQTRAYRIRFEIKTP